MKSESAVHFPETIRSALTSLNKKTTNNTTKVALLEDFDSEEESWGEGNKLLHSDHHGDDHHGDDHHDNQALHYVGGGGYQDDTDSDVSDRELEPQKSDTPPKPDKPASNSNQVILYQSIEDGTIALKAADEVYEDKSSYKESYSDSEILNGVSFKMRYLGSTPIAPIKSQVDDIRAHQAQDAIDKLTGGGRGRNVPSNAVIMTISAERLLVYDGNMQQLLMEHTIKLVSYVGDSGDYVVVMVRHPNSQARQSFKVTCHVFHSEHSQQVRIAMNKAFTLTYNDVIRRSGQNEEVLLQGAYSEVLGSQRRADEGMADLLDSSRHLTVTIIKRPQEGMGLSLTSSGPGSIIPTVIISKIKPASPAYNTEQLNVGDQILEVNDRSLCGLSYKDIFAFLKSLLPTTKIKLKVVPGSPVLVVELIRPDLKYPLGFSVKDGHITTLIRGSIGERAGVRIGHRIISINEESTVTADHDTIAGILLSETGKLVLKTMPSEIFNLMLGHETPLYL